MGILFSLFLQKRKRSSNKVRVPTHLPPPPPIKGKVKSNITYSSHKQIKILNTHNLVKKDITARLKKRAENSGTKKIKHSGGTTRKNKNL